MAAFVAALAVPACDGLEFDVRASADGVPVISHDETLERVFGRPERVDATTAARLGALGLPTLAEVLATVGRRPFLDVELKGDPGPGVVEVLAAARGPALVRAVVSSFEPASLERVARLAPDWPRWLNTWTFDAATVADALALGCRGIAVQWRALDPVSVRRAQAAGLDVAGWTVRRRPTFDRLARLGLVAVCVESAALDG
jgi:glycerophosphoryl diester phosphodiesterase